MGRMVDASLSSTSFADSSEDVFTRLLTSLEAIQTEQAKQRLMIEQIQQQGQVIEGCQKNIEAMIQAIYNWHLSQNHFPPQH